MDREPGTLWDKQADQWDRIRPPLRPHAEDLALAGTVLQEMAVALGRGLRGLTAGVTPELVELPWPSGSAVLRFDRSSAMVRALRAAGPHVPNAAIRADWSDLPVADHGVDLALGDGALNVAPRWLAEAVVPEVHRVLADHGRLVLRSFVRPDVRETPDEVWALLMAGELPSFGIFKFHLLMALVDDEGTSRVHAAWETFRGWCSSDEELAAELGWPVADVRTIDAYRDQPDAYWFPTEAQLLEVTEKHFELLDCHRPDYAMGDRCPTAVFRRR